MAAEAVASSPKRSKKPFIIAAVVVALLAVGGGAGYYFGIYAPEQAREAAEQEALAAKHAVRFTVSAEGWDTSAGASRLPLHITGKEARGKNVDVVRYVDSTGAGVELRRGSYKAEVAASPIAADGTIYAVPSEKIDVKVSKKAEGKKEHRCRQRFARCGRGNRGDRRRGCRRQEIRRGRRGRQEGGLFIRCRRIWPKRQPSAAMTP